MTAALVHEPGDSLAHRLDARTKLAFQFAFAAATFAHTTPRGVAAAGALALLVLRAARAPVFETLAAFRGFAPFLVAAPVVEGLRLGPPWFAPESAVFPALASARVLAVALVGAAYVRTTPVRESRAAVQWAVPGRVGAVLGTGTAFVLRFLPVLRADLASIRAASRARLGTERSLVDRIRLIGTTGLRRLFVRSDRFALALRARCFAWNPTLPVLSMGRLDALGLAAAGVLAGLAVV